MRPEQVPVTPDRFDRPMDDDFLPDSELQPIALLRRGWAALIRGRDLEATEGDADDE